MKRELGLKKEERREGEKSAREDRLELGVRWRI